MVVVGRRGRAKRRDVGTVIVTGGGARGEGTDIDTVGMRTVALNGVVVFAALSSIGGTECQV